MNFYLVRVMDIAEVQQSTVNPGPVDCTVLYDQDKHVSAAVWDGQERGALRCHEHTSKLDQWRLNAKQIEALGNASLASQSTISGCLTLLQCWSYYHLNVGRPKLKHDAVQDCFPYVLRWKGKQIGPTANRDVIYYRKALDALKPCDVEWLPYRNMDSTVIPEDIKWNLNLGRSKTMLICFDKAERHLPDRCLRQCGIPQPIPEFVAQWQRKNRGVDGGVDLSGKMELELNEWGNRRLNIVEGDDSTDESEYMHWYINITRRFIGRPISLSSEFQRTNSGLKDIAHIVDTFSMEGLNPQQIESISRIRYIVHECLRGQVESLVVPMASTPLLEHGKRVRGKEKVRRRGFIKHRHKDEPMEFEPNCEDDLVHYHGVAIKEDDMPLEHVEMDGSTTRLCNMGSCLVSVDGDNVHLCTDADGQEVVDHRFRSDGTFNHEEVYHSIGCGRSQLDAMTLEITDPQLHEGGDQIYETKCIDTISGVVDASPLCCSSTELGTQAATSTVEV
ncbi:hypothetical protein MLD38_040207 [Melastoma candidum]|uniref:Uncharacterized protein n=1 Tax=Melastoma candidum TaxID=119954 RepID=A0ACB9L5P5_9MYRT|nr:hypothetical protein MLD38_040207 [Melastoma candidum]